MKSISVSVRVAGAGEAKLRAGIGVKSVLPRSARGSCEIVSVCVCERECECGCGLGCECECECEPRDPWDPRDASDPHCAPHMRALRTLVPARARCAPVCALSHPPN